MSPKDTTPLKQRFLPEIIFTPEQEIKLKLIETSTKLSLNDITSSELRQLAAAYAFFSGKIEGNTYDYIETQTLLLDGVTTTKKYEDAVMLKNLFNTFLEYHKEISENGPITITRKVIEDIHFKLSDKLLPNADRGRIRMMPVFVQGSSYIPSPDHDVLVRGMETIMREYPDQKDIYKRAVFIHLNLARLQPFRDCNKQTARMVESIMLMNEGLVPVFSTSEAEVAMYRRDIIHFYETKDYSQYADFLLRNRIEFHNNHCTSKEKKISQASINLLLSHSTGKPGKSKKP